MTIVRYYRKRMAAVTESQCSTIAQFIISEVSKLNCQSEVECKIEIQNYLQLLKKQYNENILKKCLTQVVSSIDDKYYNDGISPWSDQHYDHFIEYLKSYSYLENAQIVQDIVNDAKIGAPVNVAAGEGRGGNVGNAVKLPYFMGSMNKYKTIAEIKNWARKFRGPYTLSAKLDGVSAMYYRGKLYTRGNGSYGRDISYLIPFLKQKLPDADFEFALRGELIIRKSVFVEKYSSTFANSRNLVCGLLNRVYSKENEQFYGDMDFIVYDVYYHNPLQFCNKIKIVNGSGSQMVVYEDKIDPVNLNRLDLLDSILKKWKTNYDYEIDGIIVTSDKPCIHSEHSNPDFAFAYKNNIIGVEMKQAVVDKVLWNVSKDNYLKPKIKLIQKVECDGSQIEYVTGFNAKYILQNSIQHGTVVKIGLSGNVIPHIFEIVGEEVSGDGGIWEDLAHPVTQKLLENIDCAQDSYIWNKTKVDLVSTTIDNPACVIKKNMVFFNSFEIKCGLQETTLINLYKSLGIYKLEDVLSLPLEQWEQVEKVGTKKGGKIVSALKSALDWNVIKIKSAGGLAQSSEDYFMNCLLGLQCFPRGFGKKKLDSHIKYVKQVCDKKFPKLYDLSYFGRIEKMFANNLEEYKTPQVTSDSIELFCQGYSKFINSYHNIQNKTTTIELPSLKTLLGNMTLHQGGVAKASSGKGNIVFSGVRDKETESNYINKGYEISDSVNSQTKFLVVKDKNTKSTKMKKAEALGVEIISLNEL